MSDLRWGSSHFRVTILIGDGMTNIESRSFVSLITRLLKIFKKYQNAYIVDATAFFEKESYNIKQKVIQTINQRKEAEEMSEAMKRSEIWREKYFGTNKRRDDD